MKNSTSVLSEASVCTSVLCDSEGDPGHGEEEVQQA